MTRSTNAWGWLAAGVLALGVNGFMHDEGADLVRRTTDRIAARSGILAVAAGQAQEFLAKVQLAAAREQVRPCRLGVAMARIHSRMASRAGFATFDSMSAQEEAQMAQLEAQQARMEAQMAQVQFDTSEFNVPNARVICPRVRVNIPSPVVRIPSPIIHVKPLGTGSI